MNLELLRGTKVRLTAISKDDAAAIAGWSGDVGFLRLQDSNMALPQNQAQMVANLEEMEKSSTDVGFAIRTVADGALIGTIGFYEIEWANQAAWLGMGIGPREAWGQGYGTEALRLALQYAFDELNLHRITLTVLAYNERAIALYERAGFQREGVFREFGRRDGKRYDMYLYGLLRPEWQSRAGARP
ncbi:MAG: GNAT family protein [Anaerolineae bacterium]|jgi:RimJ/RimL family protein N-acetyltransferase